MKTKPTKQGGGGGGAIRVESSGKRQHATTVVSGISLRHW